jgi:putative transposase
VRTVRAECLDWLLLLGSRQLERVLCVHVEHYNRERPHRALGRYPPVPIEARPRALASTPVRRRDRLGGLLHEYYPAAA